MDTVDLEPLRQEIRRRKLMEIWRDSLRPMSEAQRTEKARKHALEAKHTYERIMTSVRNDGSAKFRDWAIRKALGLRTTRGYTAQPTGGKHWRAWGKREAGAGSSYQPPDDDPF